MGWNRSATLLSVIIFIAFGFQVIGVFSDPVSKNTLPLATVGSYDYGVLGYCSTSSSDCSDYGLGYTLQDETSSSWSQSTQRTLSQIFVVHIVASGLLFISFIMALCTHWRNSSYWTVVEVVLGISFVAAALSFAVEVALFRTNLKFAGWFTLASTVLTLVANIGLGFMQKNLHNSLGKTNMNGKSSLFTNDPISFNNGGDFVIGRDDEKLLKQPSVSATQLSAPSMPSNSFQGSKPPSLKGPIAQRGYEKIPESRNPIARAGEKPSSTPNGSNNFPISGSTESVGAIPRPQIQGRQPISQFKPSMTQDTGAALAGPRVAYGGTMNQAQGRAEKEMGWNQSTVNNASGSQQQFSQQQKPFHASNASIASSQAVRIPAGAYLQGVNSNTDRYGPNVVQIPKVRNGITHPAESATIEYHKDETQSKSPLLQSKVPNFSRMSAQENTYGKGPTASSPQAKRSVNPMLERFVESENMDSIPKERYEPFYDSPISRIPTQSPESEASHYTSVSERNQYNQGHSKTKQENSNQVSHQNGSTYQNQLENPGHAGTGQAKNQFELNNPSYQPQYQGNYPNINYNQTTYNTTPGDGFQGGYHISNQPNYQYGYQPGYQYGHQFGYQPNYQPGYYMGAIPNNANVGGGTAYMAPSTPSRAPPKQSQQRSEFALQNNPDFSIGELGKKRRPNLR